MNSPRQDVTSFFSEIIDNLRLVSRLIMDARVPTWLKAVIPTLVAIYVLSPVDIVPDIIPGLGQLDDIAVVLLGIKLFIDMSPADVVRQHLDELRSFQSRSYRVTTENPTPKEEKPRSSAGYIETSYTVKDE
ncbi:MAG: DUF1232 domain-containing protein [Chloroflexi bacterium]|nr:DUF1232 domain-containing protein [Chloroflexota bacterium]MBU1749212.1 DUF1232 domain-containing protein [Chloroflexota bacterium]